MSLGATLRTMSRAGDGRGVLTWSAPFDTLDPVVAGDLPDVAGRDTVQQDRGPLHAAHDTVRLEDADVKVLGREAEGDRDVHEPAALQLARERDVEAVRGAEREVALPPRPEQHDH